MTETENKTDKKTDNAPEKVKVTVDGKAYEMTPGANLLDEMRRVGIEIGYFCYHPGMSVVAVCRQCLVDLKNSPKLVPACQSVVQADMEVTANSDKVLDARRAVLEFTLVNHPVDCPICDKAGECTLQKLYMEWDAEGSRTNHQRVVKGKRMDIGPRILMDQERCILCTRCQRFCEEVAKSPQLVIAQRGNHAEMTVPEGHQLDNPYSLNTVDICPVGALTDRDFRFKERVWNLMATKSVCNGCATGCQLEIHHQGDKIYRMIPRREGHDNLNWMCDYGRYTYKAQAADRLTLPRVSGRDTGWDEALGHLADQLNAIRKGDPHSLGVVLGADATNEDNFVASRVALDFLGLERLYLAAEPDTDQGDEILRSADPNPNRAGATACGRDKLKGAEELTADLIAGKLKALYVVGGVLHLSGEALSKLGELELLVIQATHPTGLTAKAHVVLPACMWQEVDGTITSAKGEHQRMHAAVKSPGFARPHWEILVKLARRMGMTLEYSSARAIFTEMQKELEFFAAADWGKDLPARLLRFAGSRG